jgi:hypothetical protein
MTATAGVGAGLKVGMMINCFAMGSANRRFTESLGEKRAARSN